MDLLSIENVRKINPKIDSIWLFEFAFYSDKPQRDRKILEAQIQASEKYIYFGNDKELDEYCDTICQLDEYCSGFKNPIKPGHCQCTEKCLFNTIKKKDKSVFKLWRITFILLKYSLMVSIITAIFFPSSYR